MILILFTYLLLFREVFDRNIMQLVNGDFMVRDFQPKNIYINDTTLCTIVHHAVKTVRKRQQLNSAMTYTILSIIIVCLNFHVAMVADATS